MSDNIRYYINEIESINKKLYPISSFEIIGSNIKWNRIVKTKLVPLINDINSDLTVAEKVYSKLLDSINPLSRKNAASNCLKLNIYVEKSIEVLEYISNNEQNANIAFSADMVLKIYRGEMPD
ncbi:MAG: hypothetical protein LBM02_08920 [Lachnospiraceae bacterium]|jgi:TnpA family transposase|nr:hypothetical protein [Lachnospiraceae bacterium]